MKLLKPNFILTILHKNISPLRHFRVLSLVFSDKKNQPLGGESEVIETKRTSLAGMFHVIYGLMISSETMKQMQMKFSEDLLVVLSKSFVHRKMPTFVHSLICIYYLCIYWLFIYLFIYLLINLLIN